MKSLEQIASALQGYDPQALSAQQVADFLRHLAPTADASDVQTCAVADALERIPIFRLAWDTALSAFAARQVLYERFFFGDPVRMAGALVGNHDAEIGALVERVREFLRTPGDG